MTKQIRAVIRKEKLTGVLRTLSDIGIVGLTVAEVRGRGRGSAMMLKWRTGTYVVELLPHVEISIVLSDENVSDTIDVIQQAAYTGEKGDGMIYVTPVEQTVRISTGETGRNAISYVGDIDTKKVKA